MAHPGSTVKLLVVISFVSLCCTGPRIVLGNSF